MQINFYIGWENKMDLTSLSLAVEEIDFQSIADNYMLMSHKIKEIPLPDPPKIIVSEVRKYNRTIVAEYFTKYYHYARMINTVSSKIYRAVNGAYSNEIFLTKSGKRKSFIQVYNPYYRNYLISKLEVVHSCLTWLLPILTPAPDQKDKYDSVVLFGTGTTNIKNLNNHYCNLGLCYLNELKKQSCGHLDLPTEIRNLSSLTNYHNFYQDLEMKGLAIINLNSSPTVSVKDDYVVSRFQ